MNNYEKIKQLEEYGFHSPAIAIYFEMLDYCKRANHVRHGVANVIRANLSELETMLLVEHKRLIKQ